MKDKIKVIVKEPNDRFGSFKYVSNDLFSLQKTVGGYLEPIYIDRKTVILCDELGKIRHLRPNIWVGEDIICGTLIVCGADGGDFTDCPFDNMMEWIEMMDRWAEKTMEEAGV